MSDSAREIEAMFTRIEPGPRMIEGELIRNVYRMLGLPGKAATIEVGIRMVDESTLREIAQLIRNQGLLERLEEPGHRLIDGSLWKSVVLQAFSPLFTTYVAGAVHFDGVTFLRNLSLQSLDSPYYSFSFWVRWAATTTGSNMLFAHDVGGLFRPVGAVGQTASPSEFFSFFSNLAGTATYEVHSGVQITSGQWHHVIGAIDTSGAKAARIYLDDVSSTVIAANTGGGFSNVTNGKNCYVGADLGGDRQIADFADIRLAPGQNWMVNGDIPLETRRLFIDENKQPVNPAIATSVMGLPSVLFSGDAASFGTNKGWGGAFTTTGTLTNAATGPSVPAPINTVAPAITGTPVTGATLVCDTGTWIHSPTSYAFAWQRDGVPLGVTTPDYRVMGTDRSHQLSCLVTASNAAGASAPKSSNVVSIPP